MAVTATKDNIITCPECGLTGDREDKTKFTKQSKAQRKDGDYQRYRCKSCRRIFIPQSLPSLPA